MNMLQFFGHARKLAAVSTWIGFSTLAACVAAPPDAGDQSELDEEDSSSDGATEAEESVAEAESEILGGQCGYLDPNTHKIVSCGSNNLTCCNSLNQGYCANLQSDKQNCGSCGHQCGAGELCSFGHCHPKFILP